MTGATFARRQLPLLALLAPGAGFLLLFFGLPLVRALLGSFAPGSSGGSYPTLDNYREIFTRPVFVDGILYSLWLAIGPTVLAVLVGVPLAALLVRSYPGKAFFGALYKIPLVVPGIVAAFLVLVLFDRGGLAHRWAALIGVELPRMVRDPAGIGIILASGWKNIPFLALIVAGSMAAIPEDLYRAARTLGAGRWTVLFRIQLPLAMPGITAAALLIFISNLGSYAAPNLLGPSYPIPVSIHMYDQGFRRGNWPLVYAMGIIVSACAIVVLLVYYRLTRKIGRQSGNAE